MRRRLGRQWLRWSRPPTARHRERSQTRRPSQADGERKGDSQEPDGQTDVAPKLVSIHPRGIGEQHDGQSDHGERPDRRRVRTEMDDDEGPWVTDWVPVNCSRRTCSTGSAGGRETTSPTRSSTGSSTPTTTPSTPARPWQAHARRVRTCLRCKTRRHCRLINVNRCQLNRQQTLRPAQQRVFGC
jgi:hypothetical protein